MPRIIFPTLVGLLVASIIMEYAIELTKLPAALSGTLGGNPVVGNTTITNAETEFHTW
jgi:hypothetical protein